MTLQYPVSTSLPGRTGIIHVRQKQSSAMLEMYPEERPDSRPVGLYPSTQDALRKVLQENQPGTQVLNPEDPEDLRVYSEIEAGGLRLHHHFCTLEFDEDGVAALREFLDVLEHFRRYEFRAGSFGLYPISNTRYVLAKIASPPGPEFRSSGLFFISDTDVPTGAVLHFLDTHGAPLVPPRTWIYDPDQELPTP